MVCDLQAILFYDIGICGIIGYWALVWSLDIKVGTHRIYRPKN